MSRLHSTRRRSLLLPTPSPVHKRPHLSSPTRLPTFPSHLDVPDLPPKIRLLCNIITQTPAPSAPSALSATALPITADDVEEVLKLSYAHPSTAVQFFRWAGEQIQDNHSPYAWNLVVDLLGKNRLFEAMWDAVKTMHRKELLSLATFASIFSSYAAADRFDDAFTSFDLMDRYAVPRDVTALNSLLSAICRHGKARYAANFLAKARTTIAPDPDSYAILLEGWEDEKDAENAVDTFAEMVGVVGWDRANVPAYDSFLSTLARSPGGMREAKKHLGVIVDKGCLPGMKFFRIAIDEYLKQRDVRGAAFIWDLMAWKNGNRPDLPLYNSMIQLHCFDNRFDNAYKLIDEMVTYGIFPDSDTYNRMLKYLLKRRKFTDVETIFSEMQKNECVPSDENCRAAFKLAMDSKDVEIMMMVWKCMVSHRMDPLEEYGNSLVQKLKDIDMLPEACKYAEEMTEIGIKVHSSTLSKLRTGLSKLGRWSLYDRLLQKWKSH